MALSDIFDVFTGNSAKEAASKQRDYLAGIQRANDLRLTGAQTGGIDALKSGQQSAIDAITGGVATGRGDIQGTSIDQAIKALYGGADTGRADLLAGQAGGLEALRSGVGLAAGAYDPLREAAGRYGLVGTQASDMLANALGLRGPEGAANATQAFQKGPGYDFMLNQGLESILRNANASGRAAGGNAFREAQTYGSGLANQTFQDWLKNIAGVGQTYSPLEAQALSQAGAGQGQAFLTGGTGAANILTGTGQRLSDLASTTGARAADIYGTGGRSLADLAARGGLAEADVFKGTGANIANLLASLAQTGVQSSNTLATPYASTYGTEAAATGAASKNIWNALGNAATFGAGGGIGNLTSGLKGLLPS